MPAALKEMMDSLHYHYIRKTNFLKWLYRTRFKSSNGLVLKKIQGSLMNLYTNDRGISYDLVIDGIREPNSTEFVKKILKKEDIVFDIGANIGYYVLIESLIATNGKVLAIEPVLNNFELLKKNVILNKRENVEFLNLAVGAKEGVEDIYISMYSNMHTLYHNPSPRTPSYNKIIGSRKVKVATLDKLSKKYKLYPDFVRMDVQGYEYNIIRGMKNILKQKKPLTLFIELHPQMMNEEHTLALLNTLKNNGFGIIKMFRDYNLARMRFKDDVEWHYSIGQLIDDKEAVSGNKGTFEIFFSNNL